MDTGTATVGRDTTLSDAYWARTLYDVSAWPGDPAGVGPHAPLPVKLYDTAGWHPLPAGIPAALGDVRRLAATFGGARHTPPLDAATLGALLHHGAGYGRWAVSPGGVAAHRLVPSAGRAYPAEVYVWLPGGGGLPGGVLYYDPAHHGLVPLRPDAGRPALDDVVAPALGADLAGAGAVVLVTMRFWKIAHRYGAYAYRLATQEAGVVAGNLLAVAAALGWRGHLHHRFLDAPLARWLGLDADEEAVAAAIPLYPWDDPRTDPSSRALPGTATSAELLARIRAIDVPYRQPSTLDRECCGPFLALDARSRLTDTAHLRPPPDGAGGEEPHGAGFPLPTDRPGPVVDLADALRARTSGPPLFNPGGEPVDADVLWRICRYAAGAYPSDVSGPGGGLAGLVVATHRVRDVPPGAYLIRDADHGGGEPHAHRLRAGAVVPRLADTVPADVSPVNFATATAVVSVVADPAAAGAWLGDRAYRVLNVAAGVVAQRVCVLAGAAGLVARPYNSYRARDVERLLGLAGTGLTPLFQIAIGRPRTAPTWHLSLSL